MARDIEHIRAIFAPIDPPGSSAVVYDGYEGRGYATEAAAAPGQLDRP